MLLHYSVLKCAEHTKYQHTDSSTVNVLHWMADFLSWTSESEQKSQQENSRDRLAISE